MKPSDIKRLLHQLDIKPSRKLGQNFLIDGNTLQLIVQAADPNPDRLTLEIGPGTGVLTEALLAAGCQHLLAIEYDARLAAYLRERFADEPRLRLIQDDACRVDYTALTEGVPYDCVANLPYAVSTVVIGTLLESANRPRRLCVLLQREMAERLAASPPGKIYGSLSVRAQACYDVEIVRIVPPTVFLPPPEVDSAIVTFQLRDDAPSADTYKAFASLVKRAFSQRRKKMSKLLRQDFPREAISDAMQTIGIQDNARAEEVTVDQFRELHRRLCQA